MSGQPRVLFLSITFDPEPGALLGLPLARWLRDHAGFEVEALTAIPWYPDGRFYPGYDLRLVQRDEMAGVPVWRVPLAPSHNRSAVNRVLTYTSFMAAALAFGARRIARPDVVFYFDNLPTTGIAAHRIARRNGARVVQHIADLWPDTVIGSGMIKSPALRNWAGKRIDKMCTSLYARHARITALSPGFKRMLIERGVPGDKIHVIYNWADESRFYPLEADASLARDLAMNGRFNVVYAGNIGPLQDLQTVVKAADLLRDQPHIQFVIIGTGPDETRLRESVARLELPNLTVRERIPLDQMNSVNALADALLVHVRDLPAMAATIPSKTQVALACGRPLLLGVRGDAADLVVRAGAGYTFTPGDPHDLARAVRQLYQLGPNERQSLGQRGREFYLREISLSSGAAQFAKVFRSALTSEVS